MSSELSVIIPSFNTGKYICDAVESIINDVPDAEIIVIDDASTDDTITNLQRMDIDTLEIVALEENTPGGAGIPSNIGLEKVGRKYVAFVDSDDFFYTGYLSEQLKQIERTGADICVASYKLLDTITHTECKGYGDERWQQLLRQQPVLSDKGAYFLLSPEPWRKIYRTRLFNNHDDVRFPENGLVNEDYPFHWYCGLVAKRGITYCDIDKYYHRIARVGQTTESLNGRAFALFDHTEELLAFIGSNAEYDKYRGELLYWLVIGSWKLRKLTSRKEEFFSAYKILLQSFDAAAVFKFEKIALAHHKSIYKAIRCSGSLAELYAALHWESSGE